MIDVHVNELSCEEDQKKMECFCVYVECAHRDTRVKAVFSLSSWEAQQSGQHDRQHTPPRVRVFGQGTIGLRYQLNSMKVA